MQFGQHVTHTKHESIIPPSLNWSKHVSYQSIGCLNWLQDKLLSKTWWKLWYCPLFSWALWQMFQSCLCIVLNNNLYLHAVIKYTFLRGHSLPAMLIFFIFAFWIKNVLANDSCQIGKHSLIYAKIKLWLSYFSCLSIYKQNNCLVMEFLHQQQHVTYFTWNFMQCVLLWPINIILWLWTGLAFGRAVPSMKPQHCCRGAPLACITSENSPVSSHMRSRESSKWLYRLWMSSIIYDLQTFSGSGKNNCTLQGPTMTYRDWQPLL